MKLQETVFLNDQSIANLIYNKISENEQTKPIRQYMGLSLSGEKCDRKLWLSYHGDAKRETDGRLLRLFRRGNLEEIQMAKDLRAIGIKLKETGKHQREVVASPKVKGHLDGVIYGGVPNAPKAMHIWECKTHNKKNFDALVKNGVYLAFYKHYAQMQCYMYLTNIDRALYTAVCKDDDRIYTERVRLNKETAKTLIDHLISLTEEENEPKGLSLDPTYFECKMCEFYTHCFNATNSTTATSENSFKEESKGDLLNVLLSRHRT